MITSLFYLLFQAKQINIFDLRDFYESKIFEVNHFKFDAARKMIVQTLPNTRITAWTKQAHMWEKLLKLLIRTFSPNLAHKSVLLLYIVVCRCRVVLGFSQPVFLKDCEEHFSIYLSPSYGNQFSFLWTFSKQNNRQPVFMTRHLILP